MKKHYTLFCFLLFSLNAFSGTGGPDLFGYTWKDSNEPDGPAYNWIDITSIPNASQVKLLGDDNSRGPFELNFNFHYYWYDVTQFWVGSNGYIMFQDGQLASPFYTFPNAALPNDVLGVCMNDLTFLGTNNPAECWYYVNPALDTLIVSWLNVPFFDTNGNGYSGSNTFQIILSAVDSSITYQYKAVDPYSPYSGSSVVGMEDYAAATGEGLEWPMTNIAQTPYNNFAIKFYYPHPPLLTNVTDAAVLQNDNPTTGAIFIPINSDPHQLTTTVRNYSTHAVNPFNVMGQVLSQNGNTEVLEDHYTDTLQEGESQELTYTAQFTPTHKDHYKFVTYSELPNDPPQSVNNSKTQVIVGIDSTESEMWLGYDSVPQINGGMFPINWVGGAGGVGNYYIPPFYPVAITKLHYYIYSFGATDAFSARVFDDDGVLGLPYTLLDSEYVSSANITLNGWTTIDLPTPIIIESGGFYISWDEIGSTISLGCNIVTGHASNRSFELFENIWGIFRYRANYNPLIAATIEKYSYPTGTTLPTDNAVSLSIYPNPASDVIDVSYSLQETDEMTLLQLTDVQGRTIQSIPITDAGGAHQKRFDISALPAGIYFMTLMSGKEKVTQKVAVSN